MGDLETGMKEEVLRSEVCRGFGITGAPVVCSVTAELG